MPGPPISISALPIQTEADVRVTDVALEGMENAGASADGLALPSPDDEDGEDEDEDEFEGDGD